LRSRGHLFKSESDTEVILHLYEEYGPGCLSRLDGMFAFAIWDARHQRLLLARDRIGIKPLVYYQDHERLLFASELKALLADARLPRQLNYGALGDYLRYSSIPDPGSIFVGVKKLLPGHYLLVENGFATTRCYWDVEDLRARTDASLKQTSEEFANNFQRAVASHMVADVPVGTFLSGGLDSSAVTAFASQSRHDAQPLNTFSITFKGSGEFDESEYAAQIARRYETHHREFDLTPDLITALPRMVWHADEPFAISSAFALYFLSELTSRHAKVVLSGDGGDEVFAGYPWRHWTEPRFPAWLVRPVVAGLDGLRMDRWPTVGNFYRRIRGILERSASAAADVYDQRLAAFSGSELATLLTADARLAIRDSSQASVVRHYYECKQEASPLARKLYTDLKTTLVSEMLTKVDRMTMAFGLEARVPFLDHHLVEWAFRLPDHHRLRGFQGKYVVKRAMEAHLPRNIIYRAKHGFNVPLRVWMRGQLQEMLRDMLSADQVRKRGLLQPNAVERTIQAHFGGEGDRSDQLFVLMVLELWCQQYLDTPATSWQRS
jgi:asparagine synthase (glutamine-hydrolysing)